MRDNEGHSLKLLGRAGMIYKDQEMEYLIDSEMLSGGQFDWVIYSDMISHYDKGKKGLVDEQKKKEILAKVIKLLESRGIKVDIV